MRSQQQCHKIKVLTAWRAVGSKHHALLTESSVVAHLNPERTATSLGARPGTLRYSVVLVPEPTGSTQVAVLWDSRVTLAHGAAVNCPAVPKDTTGVVTPKLVPVMVMMLPPAVEPSPVTEVTTGAAYLRQRMT